MILSKVAKKIKKQIQDEKRNLGYKQQQPNQLLDLGFRRRSLDPHINILNKQQQQEPNTCLQSNSQRKILKKSFQKVNLAKQMIKKSPHYNNMNNNNNFNSNNNNNNNNYNNNNNNNRNKNNNDTDDNNNNNRLLKRNDSIQVQNNDNNSQNGMSNRQLASSNSSRNKKQKNMKQLITRRKSCTCSRCGPQSEFEEKNQQIFMPKFSHDYPYLQMYFLRPLVSKMLKLIEENEYQKGKQRYLTRKSKQEEQTPKIVPTNNNLSNKQLQQQQSQQQNTQFSKQRSSEILYQHTPYPQAQNRSNMNKSQQPLLHGLSKNNSNSQTNLNPQFTTSSPIKNNNNNGIDELKQQKPGFFHTLKRQIDDLQQQKEQKPQIENQNESNVQENPMFKSSSGYLSNDKPQIQLASTPTVKRNGVNLNQIEMSLIQSFHLPEQIIKTENNSDSLSFISNSSSYISDNHDKSPNTSTNTTNRRQSQNPNRRKSVYNHGARSNSNLQKSQDSATLHKKNSISSIQLEKTPLNKQHDTAKQKIDEVDMQNEYEDDEGSQIKKNKISFINKSRKTSIKNTNNKISQEIVRENTRKASTLQINPRSLLKTKFFASIKNPMQRQQQNAIQEQENQFNDTPTSGRKNTIIEQEQHLTTQMDDSDFDYQNNQSDFKKINSNKTKIKKQFSPRHPSQQIDTNKQLESLGFKTHHNFNNYKSLNSWVETENTARKQIINNVKIKSALYLTENDKPKYCQPQFQKMLPKQKFLEETDTKLIQYKKQCGSKLNQTEKLLLKSQKLHSSVQLKKYNENSLVSKIYDEPFTSPSNSAKNSVQTKKRSFKNLQKNFNFNQGAPNYDYFTMNQNQRTQTQPNLFNYKSNPNLQTLDAQSPQSNRQLQLSSKSKQQQQSQNKQQTIPSQTRQAQNNSKKNMKQIMSLNQLDSPKIVYSPRQIQGSFKSLKQAEVQYKI